MKRKKLIKHLQNQGCILLREGSNHSLYVNDAKKKVSTVPRHKEIDEFLVKKICKDLEIVSP
jgi:mRNA interferase HicA